MPWPRSERGSPVPKPKARSLILVPRQNRNVRALYILVQRLWRPARWPWPGRSTMNQCSRSPTTGHERGGCLPFSRRGRSFLFWRGTRMRLRAFGLGTGLPRSDLGQGTWVRVRDLTRYLQGYLYIPRGIYKYLAVFIYP